MRHKAWKGKGAGGEDMWTSGHLPIRQRHV